MAIGRSSRARWLFLVVAAVGTVLALGPNDAEESVDTVQPSSAEPRNGEDPAQLPDRPEAPAEEPTQPRTTPTPFSSDSLSHTSVVGGDLSPVPTASASVCSTEFSALGSSQLHDLARDEVNGVVWLAADVAGIISGGWKPDPNHGGDHILWVTKPGFYAWHSRIKDRLPEQIQLTFAPRRLVTVSEPSGEPVSAAKIVHLAAPSTVAGPDQSLADRAFYRVYETGEDGTAVIPCFPAADRLQAFTRGGCSRLASSDGESAVDLFIEEACVASGMIYEEEAIDLDGVPLSISCRSQEGQILAQAQAAGSGDWGPMQVPSGHSQQLSFEIVGGKVIPQKVWVPAPSHGGSIHVDFHIRPGADLWFQVYGDAEEILPDATVEVEWDGPDGVVVAKMTPRDDDYIWVGGCRPGIVRYRASAPGYSDFIGDPVIVPETDPMVRELYLKRTGLVRGICTLEGQPVPQFEVCYWRWLDDESATSEQFWNRTDGSFELTGVPLGEIRLVAVSEVAVSGQPVTALVTPQGEPRLELKLTAPTVGSGRVLDRETLSPLAGATVQVFTAGDQQAIKPWGEETTTDVNGRFRVDGLAGNGQMIKVNLAGYAEADARSHRFLDGASNGDTILLQKAQDLTITLEPPPGVSAASYSVAIDGSEESTRAFSSAGLADFPRMSPGHYRLWLNQPDGDRRVLSMTLVPGEDWHYSYALGASRTLELTITPRDGEELPEDAWVVAIYKEGGMMTEWGQALPRDGHLTFAGIPADSVSIDVVGRGRHVVLASEHIDLTSEGTTEHQLVLSGSSRTYRVVRPSGEPVASIPVRFLLPGPVNRSVVSVTGPDGECRTSVSGDGPGSVLLLDRSIDATAIVSFGALTLEAEGPTEVLFDPSSSLRIRCVDGSDAAQGVAAHVSIAEYSDKVAPTRYTDSQGMAEWPRVSRSEFIVQTESPRHWPTRSVLMPDSGTLHDIQVRGLTDFEITVRESSGTPLPGARVDMRAEELGEKVADWVRAGRAQASSAQLRTGGDGKLLLQGIPRDRYTVTVFADSGSAWSKTIAIASGEKAELDVVLP